MIKTILVPATGSDSDLAVFGSALSVARLFGAHIDALHAHLDPVEVAVRLTSDTAGTPLVGGLIEKLEEDFRAREEKAKRLFENFCSGEGIALLEEATTGRKEVTAEWHVETGHEGQLIAVSGMTADLIRRGSRCRRQCERSIDTRGGPIGYRPASADPDELAGSTNRGRHDRNRVETHAAGRPCRHGGNASPRRCSKNNRGQRGGASGSIRRRGAGAEPSSSWFSCRGGADRCG
jgi:hypothetical protein